jgi:hypothetical protein
VPYPGKSPDFLDMGNERLSAHIQENHQISWIWEMIGLAPISRENSSFPGYGEERPVVPYRGNSVDFLEMGNGLPGSLDVDSYIGTNASAHIHKLSIHSLRTCVQRTQHSSGRRNSQELCMANIPPPEASVRCDNILR